MAKLVKFTEGSGKTIAINPANVVDVTADERGAKMAVIHTNAVQGRHQIHVDGTVDQVVGKLNTDKGEKATA